MTTDGGSAPSSPPVAPVRPHVHRAHGVERPDDYFWFRDKTDPEVLAYYEAERAFYDAAMEPLRPLVEQLQAEMVARVQPEEESVRWREGEYLYFTRTLGGLEFDQFCRVPVDDPAAEPQVLLDENELTGDSSYVALGVRSVSPDGAVLAYSVDTDGDEVYELRFRDLRSGADLEDRLPRTYYGSAWSADSSTFFYVVHDHLYRPFQVWRHRLGSSAGDDVLVFEDLDEQYDVVVSAARSGGLVVIRTFNRDTTEVWLVPADRPEEPARVVERRQRGVEYTVDHVPGANGGDLLVVTNDGAPEYRLMRTAVAEPGRVHWVEIMPEHPNERLERVEVFAHHVVLAFVSEGRQLLRGLPLTALGAEDQEHDSHEIEAEVPGGLLVLGPNEEPDVRSILIEVQSYAEPPAWYEVDLDSGARSLVKRREVPTYDRTLYTTEIRWVDARDGERVPVEVVHHKDTPLDGTAPLLLYGYGAYESSFWPGFELALASLLDRGVVFAHAHIRGGGERGRRWWLEGHLLHKRNTFTDFIDVADALARDGVIDGDRIVSRGLSAGGLLQGAVFSMRPDRWRGVVAEVPFVDVVTTMFDLDLPLTANELDEWGDPRKPDEFEYLLSYSPYDNVPAGPRPPLLATGAVHDPRVPVHEPAKWVARLRATDNGGNGRVLLRVETGEGGHTGPTGRYAHLAYEAEVAAWILHTMSLADSR